MMAFILAMLFVAVQTAAGAVWWRIARGDSVRPLEAAGIGLALGTAAATVSGLLLSAFVPAAIAWSAPSIVTLLALPWILLRHRHVLVAWPSTPWAPAIVALAVGGVAGLGSLVINLRNYPLTSSEPITTYHPDMLFFEALSTSLARLGSGDSIFMSGFDLRYHWFSYAWSGQISAAVGAEPFLVLTRVLPVVSLIGTLLIAIAWTQRLTRGRWAPTIAALLLVAGGYVGATYGTILNFDSPSQAMTTVWLLGLSIAGLALVSRRAVRWAPRVALTSVVALLAAATTGGKISSIVIVVAAWALLAVVATIRREEWAARAWLALAATTAAAAAVYVMVVAGSAEQGGLGFGSLLNKASSVQGLNPVNHSWGIIAGTLILAIAVIPRWAGVLWLVVSPASRWRPLTIFSIGIGGSGLVSLLLLSGGLNDLWFALAASAPLAVASAVGVSRGVAATFPGRGWRPSRQALLAIAGGVVLSAAVALIWRAGQNGTLPVRWLGPVVALAGAILVGLAIARRARPSGRAQAFSLTILTLVTLACLGRVLSLDSAGFAVQPEAGFQATEFGPKPPFADAIDLEPVSSWTPTQAAAAQWLDDNAEPGDVTATNLTFSPLVSALSRQQTWISAIQYQAPYGRSDAVQTALDRESLSWAFTGSSGHYPGYKLCEGGVDWVWVDPSRTIVSSWLPYATIAVSEPDVIILKLDQQVCADLLARG